MKICSKRYKLTIDFASFPSKHTFYKFIGCWRTTCCEGQRLFSCSASFICVLHKAMQVLVMRILIVAVMI